MKFKIFLLFQEITIFNIISFSFSQISSTIPLYKLILSENITNLEADYLYNLYLDTKGIGLIFDNSSNINLIPNHIFRQIYRFYYDSYDDILTKIVKLPNGYNEFVIISSLYRFETIHFILKDFGISFPLNELFILRNITKHEYSFRFLSKEEQENFIFGNDLIKTMDINFTENDNNFIINNKNFTLIVKED